MKLAVFTGQYFWFDGNNYSTDEAFVTFVTSFYPYFEKIIFCDAVSNQKRSEVYTLNPEFTAVSPLPHFNTYSIVRNLFVVFPQIYRVVKRRMRDWDIIWLPGPHPVGLLFSYICLRQKKPFFQLIRANLLEQVRHTNRGIKRYIAMVVVMLLEHVSRKLAQHHVTFTVGREMFQKYPTESGKVYETRISLITTKDVEQTLETRRFRLHTPLRLLSVGRLDPEKGLSYLIEAVEQLVRLHGLTVSLKVIGKGYKGTEERILREAVKSRDLTNHIQFLGYIPFGPELLEMYRDHDIFILPSLTGEGVPQTIFEAMACGTPVVATAVAGIPNVIQDERTGLLIKPRSSTAIAEAVKRLTTNEELRKRLAANGLEKAKHHTLDLERDRMIDRIRNLVEDSSV